MFLLLYCLKSETGTLVHGVLHRCRVTAARKMLPSAVSRLAEMCIADLLTKIDQFVPQYFLNLSLKTLSSTAAPLGQRAVNGARSRDLTMQRHGLTGNINPQKLYPPRSFYCCLSPRLGDVYYRRASDKQPGIVLVRNLRLIGWRKRQKGSRVKQTWFSFLYVFPTKSSWRFVSKPEHAVYGIKRPQE